MTKLETIVRFWILTLVTVILAAVFLNKCSTKGNVTLPAGPATVKVVGNVVDVIGISSPQPGQRATASTKQIRYLPPEGRVELSLSEDKRVTSVRVVGSGFCFRPGLILTCVTPYEPALGLDIRFAFANHYTASGGLLYRVVSKSVVGYLGVGYTFYRSTSVVAVVTADKQIGAGLRLSF
jgi:hypothetical protein